MDQALQAGPHSPRDIPDGTPGMLLSALPEGWQVVGRCRFGTAGPVGPASGSHALAHPAIGLALIDVAPDATPNAEARLRRALGSADFWKDFPGTLPVWHGRIEIGAVRGLPGLLAEGFSTLPPLTVPGKAAWIAAVRNALATDAAWEVPGQAPRRLHAPPPLEEDLAEPEDRPRRRLPPRLRPGLLGMALAGGFVLIVGLALLGSNGPAVEPVAPPPVRTAAAPAPVVPAPVAVAPVVAEPSLPPIEKVIVAMPPPAVVATPPPARVTTPVATPVAAPVVPEPAPVMPAEAEPVIEEVALAMPPPAPPPAPPLRRASAPTRIDPGCARALFRYQQGLPLSATETAHVRNGCATRR